MRSKLLLSFFIFTTLILFNIAAANAQTIEWGPVQHGVFTPYYDSSTNSDEGFDLSTGQMTTDLANRDFILYQGLEMVNVKGVDNYWDELLTVVTKEPESLVETEYALFTDTTYLIRCRDNTYAKLIVTKETPERVEFDYVLQNANITTNISGSTITNSNIGSSNQTSQTAANNSVLTMTPYVNVMVNGQPLQTDVKPFINADGRTMLPIRAISEALGAQVQWDNASQTATLTQGPKIVKVPIGQKNIEVDGKQVPMDTAAVIKDGRTLLPVRAVGEALDAKIGWERQTSTVSIEPLGSQLGQDESADQLSTVTVGESSGNGLSASSRVKIEPAKINSVIGNAFNQFNQLTKVDKLSPVDALSQQIASLRLQSDVDQVEQIADSSNLKVRFKDGYELVMLQGEESERGGLTLPTSTINPAEVPPSVVIPQVEPKPVLGTVLDAAPSLDPNILHKIEVKMNETMQIDSSDMRSLTGRNAIIFDATADDPHEMSGLDSRISNQLTEMGYSTQVFPNDEATLSRLADIDIYNVGIMVIIGHGGVVDGDYYFMTRPWYSSPPPADSGFTGTRVFAANNGAAGQYQYHYAVGSQFAQAYWTNRFPGTMFVLDTCQGTKAAGIPGLPTWTLNNGASAWVGWDDSVTFESGDMGTAMFFRQLNDWKTVNQSRSYVNATVRTPPRLILVTASGSGEGNKILPHRFWDNSESGDGQDFLLMKAEKCDSLLSVRVYFSDIYSSKLFYLYFDNNNDGKNEIIVECTPACYRIYSVSNEQSTLVSSGTPSINGYRYGMDLPWETVFGHGYINKFYMVDLSNGYQRPKDWMPDNGRYSMTRGE